MLLTITLSCGDDDGASASSDLEVNLDVQAILNLTNAHRQAGATCGSTQASSVSNLTWSDELAKAALDHSNDMQQNEYFSHTSQDGRTFSERVEAAGFEGSPVGENIALGQQSEESVIESWMNSEGHCTNIMNENATHIGIARSDEGAYWTMVLGRKSE